MVLYCNRLITLFIQILHEKKIKKKNLILQYLEKYNKRTTAGIQGLASCEQARVTTDWSRERRWETVELKDRQQ